MHWYQMIVKDMPLKLLDEKRKPDCEKLRHYGNLSDEEHDQMKAIKQKYPHLSPAIANGINKHMAHPLRVILHLGKQAPGDPALVH